MLYKTGLFLPTEQCLCNRYLFIGYCIAVVTLYMWKLLKCINQVMIKL